MNSSQDSDSNCSDNDDDDEDFHIISKVLSSCGNNFHVHFRFVRFYFHKEEEEDFHTILKISCGGRDAVNF